MANSIISLNIISSDISIGIFSSLYVIVVSDLLGKRHDVFLNSWRLSSGYER